jgi:hypothetical protein
VGGRTVADVVDVSAPVEHRLALGRDFHHGWLSAVTATFVIDRVVAIMSTQRGFVFGLVPGTTPKKARLPD